LVDAIIDAHHHIWRLAETPWLQGPPVPRIFGAYDAIRRDYAIADYLADAKPSGVVKSVFVQVNVAPGKEVDEAAWVQSVADVNGFPHAITAYADLASPSIADTLDRDASLPAATCAPYASSCIGTRSRSTASRRNPTS
jgi:predicted TIM-barrel fold metal-dependent hydrolase